MDKYIFFDGTLQEGGAERVLSILTSHLSENGKDVEIVLYYDREIFYKINKNVKITVVEKETGSKSILKNLLWLREYFKKNGNIIISFLAPFNMFALVAHMFINKPIIVADRNDPRHVPEKLFFRKCRDFLYLFSDGVVIQTSSNQSYFSDSIRKKSTVIYNPVDLKDYKALALSTNKEKKIVSVGRLMPQKNQKNMISAFAEFLKTHNDYTFTIYGEGPYREELQNYISQLNLNEKVFLPGSVKNVFDYIKDAEVFVLSSDYEGMPNALIEAMCIGLTVISTTVSGATDLIRDGVNGFLVEKNNPQKMTEALKKIADDKELRIRMAKEAVKLNDVLAAKKIMLQWEKYIDEVGEKK